MSILYCSIPDFLVALAMRGQPALAGRPFALLGADECVWAASPSARICGISVAMPARQARARCPNLLLYPLNVAESEAQRSAFLAELGAWELPAEAHGWGAGWVDLHTVTTKHKEAQELAAELGKRMRTVLGADLTPSLGWDSSKFTSRVAASAAHAGAMRLVGKAEESRFLSPQPLSLLPLHPQSVQQLRWLGIQTLGQFARLPSAGVLQRWGQAGKVAQSWAQGKDNRPVANMLGAAPETVSVELDPPTERIGRVLADAMQALAPLLARLAQGLLGVRRLRAILHFVTGPNREVNLTFVESASDAARIQSALAQQLQSIIWHDELERLEIHLIETGELAAGQMTLFDVDRADSLAVSELAQQLNGRYGKAFFLGQMQEESHPAHDRIWRLQPV